MPALDRGARRPPARSRTPRSSSLSGGNQQKIVLAKWLRVRPRVLLLDEPTQGVDVHAKAIIHRLAREAASGGAAVVIASSDDEELCECCDRVLVVRDGRIPVSSGETTSIRTSLHGFSSPRSSELTRRRDRLARQLAVGVDEIVLARGTPFSSSAGARRSDVRGRRGRHAGRSGAGGVSARGLTRAPARSTTRVCPRRRGEASAHERPDRRQPHRGDAGAARGSAPARFRGPVPVHAARAAAVLGCRHRGVGHHARARHPVARGRGRRPRGRAGRRREPVPGRVRGARGRLRTTSSSSRRFPHACRTGSTSTCRRACSGSGSRSRSSPRRRPTARSRAPATASGADEAGPSDGQADARVPDERRRAISSRTAPTRTRGPRPFPGQVATRRRAPGPAGERC